MRSMTARQGQILVRGVPPDMDSSTIRQAFSHYGKITLVGQTVHGYVVTFENVAVALTAANQEGPKLDDQSLEVWLLRPDVHGCEVIVTSGQVAVNVGRKVLTKITEDKKCHDNFDLKLSLSCTGKFWWNHPGQIGVTCSSPQDLIGWELSVLSELKDLLRPFRQWLEEQQDQISIWERVVGQDSPGSTWADDFTEVTIPFSVFDEFKFHFFTEEQYGHHLSKTFQQLVFCSDAADKTLTMKGSGSTVEKALKRLSSDHKQLSPKHITIPDTLRQIWKKPSAQKWLQHVFDSENIICSWKETRSFVRSVFDYRGTFLITAFDSDHPKIDRIFKSCFVEAKLRVSRGQIRLLETDTFKSAVKMGIKENEPSPVVFVSPSTGNVTIIDRPARMETTRRTVINFLYDQLIRRHPILCDEPIEETIQDLKPYQVRFLSLPRVMQLLSRDLQQTVFLDSDAAMVFIRAPIDQKDKCVIHVLKYIATISQKIIMLPPALAEIYRQQAVVHYVQGKLDSERLLCHWEVEKGRIIVSAQDADQDNLKRTFLTVFTETQLRIHVQENRPVVRSRDWQTFATNLQKGEEGLSAPVLRWTTSGDVVVVVDRPENIHKTRDAVYRFLVSRGSQMPMPADTTVQMKSSSVMSADVHEEAHAKEEAHRRVNVSGREERGENGDHSSSTFPKCIEHGVLRFDSADATRPESAHADCDQTYPKVVVSSEDKTPFRAHCDMDGELSAWQQQQLSLLTFVQLVELSTHLGVTQSDINNILSRSEDVETRMSRFNISLKSLDIRETQESFTTPTEASEVVKECVRPKIPDRIRQ
ncbi:uncharacterized protein [Littorina saxatilis]|uniref:uncharacterized protein n=1 Tax=Littorina saxatilis TaxID=31220 RepID=UPI0038B54EDE